MKRIINLLLIVVLVSSNLLGLLPQGPTAGLVRQAQAAESLSPAAQAGTILYVKPGGIGDCSSWASACELQTALSVAVAGADI